GTFFAMFVHHIARHVGAYVAIRQQRPRSLSGLEHAEQRTGLGIALGEQQYIEGLRCRHDDQIGLRVAVAETGRGHSQSFPESRARRIRRPGGMCFVGLCVHVFTIGLQLPALPRPALSISHASRTIQPGTSRYQATPASKALTSREATSAGRKAALPPSTGVSAVMAAANMTRLSMPRCAATNVERATGAPDRKSVV